MAKPVHKHTATQPERPRGLYDPEYDAITIYLGGTFYKKHATDPTPDIAGYALGTRALAGAWPAARKKFLVKDSATAFLKSIIPDQPHAFDPVGAKGIDLHATYEDRINSYAENLLSGAMWCLNVYPQYMECPGIASQLHGDHKLPETKMAAINAACGTNVDVHFIWQQEGAQWLRGYCVLQGADHLNVAISGLTIATGCDFGSKGEREMVALGYSDPQAPVMVKLRPYFNLKFIDKILHAPKNGKSYTDWNGSRISQEIALRGPIPVLTKDEADDLDLKSFISQIKTVRNFWNSHRPQVPHGAPAHHAPAHTAPLHHAAPPAPPGGPAPAANTPPPPPPKLKPFSQLTPAWQTVLADWVFQHGPGVFTRADYAIAAARGDAVLAKRLLAAAATRALGKKDHRPQNQSDELKNDYSTLTIDPVQPATKPAAVLPPANANHPAR